MKKTINDWKENPVTEIERLMSKAPPEMVAFVQQQLITMCEKTNKALGYSDEKFETAIRSLHENPTLMRDLAPEFRFPVEEILRTVSAVYKNQD